MSPYAIAYLFGAFFLILGRFVAGGMCLIFLSELSHAAKAKDKMTGEAARI
jgi:hypothetical protein